MTGLVNSIINLAVLPPPAGAVVQAALFEDDTQRIIADLTQRLRESESSYDVSCNTIDALEQANHKLQQENKELRIGLEMARRVNAVCACGIVRR